MQLRINTNFLSSDWQRNIGRNMKETLKEMPFNFIIFNKHRLI